MDTPWKSRWVGFATCVITIAVLITGCGGGRVLSGTYESKDPKEGGMSLQFGSDKKVHVTLYDPPHEEKTTSGEYEINGDRITLRVASTNNPIVLTRKGDALEMSIPSKEKVVRLTKK